MRLKVEHDNQGKVAMCKWLKPSAAVTALAGLHRHRAILSKFYVFLPVYKAVVVSMKSKQTCTASFCHL